jgi:hypothetical protein
VRGVVRVVVVRGEDWGVVMVAVRAVEGLVVVEKGAMVGVGLLKQQPQCKPCDP